MITAYFYALVAAIFWGAGFIGSRYGLEEVGPLWLTFFRFLVASIVLLPLLKNVKKEQFNLKLVGGSFVSSIFLTSLIALQIAGLQYTTVAKSGFITILYAFFTPIICYVLFKKKISQNFWILLTLAFIGMLLITEFNMSTLNYGDFLTLLCALASALHIISISHLSKNHATGLFNLMQLFFVAAICLPLALYFEGIPSSISSLSIIDNKMAIAGIMFMGVFSTSIGFFLQVKAQQKVPAHVAGLIFLLESPIAALLGYSVFDESMSMVAIFGCGIVIISVGIMPFENLEFNTIKKIRNHAVKFANILSVLVLCYF